MLDQPPTWTCHNCKCLQAPNDVAKMMGHWDGMPPLGLKSWILRIGNPRRSMTVLGLSWITWGKSHFGYAALASMSVRLDPCCRGTGNHRVQKFAVGNSVTVDLQLSTFGPGILWPIFIKNKHHDQPLSLEPQVETCSCSCIPTLKLKAISPNHADIQ